MALVACGSSRPIENSQPWLHAAKPTADAPLSRGQQFPVDLKSVLTLAGTSPIDIQIAVTEAEYADAEEGLAQSQWLPKLQPRMTLFGHDGAAQETGGNFIDVQKQNTFAGAGLNLNIPLAQAIYDPLAAAQRSRAARLGIRVSQDVNVGAAIDLYYGLLQEQVSVQIAQRSVEHAQQLVEIETSKAEAGRSLEAHVLRAKAFLAAQEGRHAEFQARAHEKSASLTALLVLPEEFALSAQVEEIEPIRFPEAKQPLLILLERALANRPDLQQAKAVAAAHAEDRSKAAYSWLLPELNLGAEVGGYGRVPSEYDQRENYYAGLEWTLEFGTISRTRAAGARQKGAELRVEGLRHSIQAALRTVLARIESAGYRMASAQREIEASTASLALVKAQNDAGTALLVEVLDAQRAATEAGINLARAICEQNRAQFALQRLVGWAQ